MSFFKAVNNEASSSTSAKFLSSSNMSSSMFESGPIHIVSVTDKQDVTSDHRDSSPMSVGLAHSNRVGIDQLSSDPVCSSQANSEHEDSAQPDIA
ncbi:hypothetical protein V6N11_076974 [Hibiscus sabdariffa]|uniref:Uncharacterized protein n=1 Tax=Hibiscus sabdariffa TaxID=183260 RepID=A0ABR2TC07_9ROSI